MQPSKNGSSPDLKMPCQSSPSQSPDPESPDVKPQLGNIQLVHNYQRHLIATIKTPTTKILINNTAINSIANK